MDKNKSPVKLILLSFLLLVFAVGYVGFALPYLFSCKANTPIFIGIISIPFSIIIFYKLIKSVMKNIKVLLVLAIGLLTMSSCSKVPAGHVGVKFYLLGGSKGVDHEELSPGRYWIGMNEELYLFPTFTQNYVWTASKDEGSKNDESIAFQTAEGMSVGADVGITYHLQSDKIPMIFEKYKKGIDEITDVFLRNMVRDAFVNAASKCKVESVYGAGKGKLIDEVETAVRNEVAPIGIIIDKIYLVGDMRLPKTVIGALNRKIEATQRAEQRENELREAEAEAKKKIAQANGDASATLARAEAQAKANRLLNASITPTLIEYEKVKKWDGKVSTVSGNGASIINLK